MIIAFFELFLQTVERYLILFTTYEYYKQEKKSTLFLPTLFIFRFVSQKIRIIYCVILKLLHQIHFLKNQLITIEDTFDKSKVSSHT